MSVRRGKANILPWAEQPRQRVRTEAGRCTRYIRFTVRISLNRDAVEPRLRWPHQQGGINDRRRSFSQLRDHAEPQGNETRSRGAVRRLLAHGGVHHDELGGRIDENHLAADSDQGKTPLLAGRDPYLVSIAEIWGGGSRSEIGVARIHRRRVQEPLPWNQLASIPCAVISEQPTQSRIIPQGCVEAAEGGFLPGAVDGPRSVGLGADRAPDLVAKIVRNGHARGGPQHQAQDFRLDAGVVPFGSRRSDAGVELGNAGNGILAGLTE